MPLETSTFTYEDIFRRARPEIVGQVSWESWNLINTTPSQQLLEAAREVETDEESAYDILAQGYIRAMCEGVDGQLNYLNNKLGADWSKPQTPPATIRHYGEIYDFDIDC